MAATSSKFILSLSMFLCLLDMPYGYYQFVRFACLIVFSWPAYYAFEEERQIEGFIYLALAILFQPLFKIALGRFIWNFLDVVIGVGLIVSIFIKSPAVIKKRR